ncbi:MAG TPA: multiheme c-type cytochrome [Dehalococcoidia bacterium]|nr:multiheme c-type cytochrome [Dehalococcoidia bacterium]
MAATVACSRCHITATGEYEGSVHSQDLLSRGKGAPCDNCHSPDDSAHTIAWLDGEHSGLTLEPVNQTCGRCHQAELSSYLDTSHGKMAQSGDDVSAATCVTCHGDHAVAAVDDPGAPLTALSLAPICGQCHRGADAEFAEAWQGHAELSPSNLPGLYYMERSITFLTAATLGFGFLHVSLDFLRRLAGWVKRRNE